MQVRGPEATIAGARSRTAAFTPVEGGTYTFQLDVEAEDGRRGSDQVDVQVLDKAGCASAPAGAWWLALPLLILARRRTVVEPT